MSLQQIQQLQNPDLLIFLQATTYMTLLTTYLTHPIYSIITNHKLELTIYGIMNL